MTRRSIVLFAVLAIGCDKQQAGSTPPPPTDPAALMRTLEALAMPGEKRVGTEGAHKAGEWVLAQMKAIGLTDPRTETFSFPRHDLMSASMTVKVDGVAQMPGFDVFEGAGSGHAEGPVVWVGAAMDADLAGVDLTGKIAFVERIQSFHRSSQYRNVAAKGATAMLYVSAAPDNLRQVGSVRLTFESQGPIPAITLGADDGKALVDAVMAKNDVRATIDVKVQTTAASGSNVIATIPGRDNGEIVIGAHYDTWFVGSSDNGGGIAALLALAARRAKEGQPRYTLVFVGYDGEEVALYGGYDFLRRHRIVGQEPILAVLNFEVPSAKDSHLLGLAHSSQGALDEALQGAGLPQLYPLYSTLDVVPKLFGGIIPTDIQGIYRNGVPTISTAVDAKYYHTTADTPDKVDADMLASAIDEFDAALGTLLADDNLRFKERDPKLWIATVTARARGASDPLTVDATITDAAGTPQANAPAQALLLVDDFTQTGQQAVMTDANGKASFVFPAAAVTQGTTHRFVHVTAGPTYPLVEQVIALP